MDFILMRPHAHKLMPLVPARSIGSVSEPTLHIVVTQLILIEFSLLSLAKFTIHLDHSVCSRIGMPFRMEWNFLTHYHSVHTFNEDKVLMRISSFEQLVSLSTRKNRRENINICLKLSLTLKWVLIKHNLSLICFLMGFGGRQSLSTKIDFLHLFQCNCVTMFYSTIEKASIKIELEQNSEQ